MCGRFTLTRPAAAVAALQLDSAPELPARFNIAPTQSVLAVRARGQAREGVLLRWGLIPSWAADPSIGSRLVNARAETAASKPSFRNALARRRCLVPADGFYEWQTIRGKKQPLYFRLREGGVFALAGLWERWQPPEGPPLESCTILTTSANELIRPYHDRMPVILGPAQYTAWLDPARTDASQFTSWLVSWPAEEMVVVPASPHVNNPRHEGPGCLAGESSLWNEGVEAGKASPAHAGTIIPPVRQP